MISSRSDTSNNVIVIFKKKKKCCQTKQGLKHDMNGHLWEGEKTKQQQGRESTKAKKKKKGKILQVVAQSV